MKRTGFELPLGILATYVIIRLWWNGYFSDLGIELLAPYMPDTLESGGGDLLSAEEVYGESLTGKLLIELINLMVGIGTAVLWIATGLFAILKDVLSGLVDASGFTRNLKWPSPWKSTAREEASQPSDDPYSAAKDGEEASRIAFADSLIKAAVAGNRDGVIAMAEALHRSPFMSAEPIQDEILTATAEDTKATTKVAAKPTTRRSRAKKKA